MNKFYRVAVVLAVFLILSAAMAVAESNARQPEKTDGFVCPVLGGKAGEGQGNSSGKTPIATIGNDDKTVIGPKVSVPIHATNDEGAGSPGADHASPGEPSYTAIWAGN